MASPRDCGTYTSAVRRVGTVSDRTPIATLEDVEVRFASDHIETTDLELYDGWVRLADGKWITRDQVQSIQE